MIVFDFDPGKCSACGGCAVACMDENDIDIEGGQQPYRRIYSFERGGRLLSLSLSCLHCGEPPCVPACPMGCLGKDGETGLTLAQTAGCIGCRACFRACPYGAPTFRKTEEAGRNGKMEKCHGCLGRIRAGLDPACVRACPTGALTWHREDTQRTNQLGALYLQWSRSE